jgi:hypothetical protein
MFSWRWIVPQMIMHFSAASSQYIPSFSAISAMEGILIFLIDFILSINSPVTYQF